MSSIKAVLFFLFVALIGALVASTVGNDTVVASVSEPVVFQANGMTCVSLDGQLDCEFPPVEEICCENTCGVTQVFTTAEIVKVTELVTVTETITIPQVQLITVTETVTVPQIITRTEVITVPVITTPITSTTPVTDDVVSIVIPGLPEGDSIPDPTTPDPTDEPTETPEVETPGQDEAPEPQDDRPRCDQGVGNGADCTPGRSDDTVRDGHPQPPNDEQPDNTPGNPERNENGNSGGNGNGGGNGKGKGKGS